MKEQTYPIIRITEQPALIRPAAAWFHSTFSVPEEAYRASMQESVKSISVVPQWYLVLDEDAIIAGCGVIERLSRTKRPGAQCVRGLCGRSVPRAGRREQTAALCRRRYGCKRDRHPVSADRPHRFLRTLRLGVYRAGVGRRGERNLAHVPASDFHDNRGNLGCIL